MKKVTGFFQKSFSVGELFSLCNYAAQNNSLAKKENLKNQ